MKFSEMSKEELEKHILELHYDLLGQSMVVKTYEEISPNSQTAKNKRKTLHEIENELKAAESALEKMFGN